MFSGDNKMVRQVVVAQGMATPEHADEALRMVEAGEGTSLADVLLCKGYITQDDHAILLRIFAPAPPSSPAPTPAVMREDSDTTFEKIVTASGILPSEFIAAARSLQARRETADRPALHKVLHEEGYMTSMQVTKILREIEAAGYRCEGCGKEYERTGKRGPSKCPHCGIMLPQPGVPVSLEATFDREGLRTLGTLTVISGVNRGMVYEISENSRITIGRRPANKIRVFGKQVSRAHAEIVQGDEGILIRDLKSSFGTMVNGRPIETHALCDADLVRIGGSVFEFRASPQLNDLGAADTGVRDLLFGRVAVRLGFVTRAQIDEAVALQETTHAGVKLGKILIERGSLTQSGLIRVINVQQRNSRQGTQPGSKEGKPLFGRLAVQERLIDDTRLNETLRLQAKTEDHSGLHLKIGELLVRLGHMDFDGVQRILDLQGRAETAIHVPGYEIVSKLGEGGMGAVYRAKQLSLDRDVAVKVLSSRLARDPTYIERFLREARAAAALSHENIIRAIDVGSSAGHHYFVMEFVEGTTALEQVRRRGALDERDVVRIGIQMARALDHAHSHGIIHRDVKPENIMITQDGLAKLCDLGLARDLGKDAAGEAEDAVGTPNYISPEQARGEAQIDIRTDIYSLGATLYHLATGQMPFRKPAPPMVVMARHLTEQIPHPRRVRPALTEGFCKVVEKMMVKDPGKRYRTPGEILDDLVLLSSGKPPQNAAATGALSTVQRY